MKHVYNFKMTVADYRDMITCKTFGTQTWKRVFLATCWVIFGMILLLDYTNVIQISTTIHVCALLVTVALPATLITMEVNIHKYKEAYQNGFKAERQITVTDEGMIFKNRASDESGFNPWSDISRLDEMKKVFVIQLEAREAVILPKRAMGTQAKVDEFIAVVKEHIPDKFHPMRKEKQLKKTA